jgi:hypothetical protein
MNPGSGSTIGFKKLTDQGYIDVQFNKGTNALDLNTITDQEAEFALVLSNGTEVEITGMPTKVTGTSNENVYRYTIPSNVNLTPGSYQVRFLAGSFADTKSTTNVSETEQFAVAVPQAHLAGPKDGGQIDVRALNASQSITVRFQGLPGGILDSASILDSAPEFTLIGAAAQGVAINATPVKIDAYTYKYTFTGQFGIGPVTVNFLANSFKDSDSNQSQAATETFTVIGPTANLLSRAADINVLNTQGYIDVYF